MTGKVKCTCGWSWNKSDSSKKDMYICHECGRDNSNNIPKAQNGEISKKVIDPLIPYSNEYIDDLENDYLKLYNDPNIRMDDGFDAYYNSMVDNLPNVTTTAKGWVVYKPGTEIEEFTKDDGTGTAPIPGKNRMVKRVEDYEISDRPNTSEQFRLAKYIQQRSINKLDNRTVSNKGYDINVPKQKNGGWLDNYNDSQASAPEGMEGDGFSNVGRNYSPAWGGQFQNGGKAPKYVESKNDPRYKAYQDSLYVHNDLENFNKVAANIYNKNINKKITNEEAHTQYEKEASRNNYKSANIIEKRKWELPTPIGHWNTVVSNKNGYTDTYDVGYEENHFPKPQQEVIVKPLEALQHNLHPVEPMSQGINANAEIHPEVRHAKSWKYNTREGRSEESGYVNSPEDMDYYSRLRDFYQIGAGKGLGNKVEITPQYQMGGSVYPVNYVPQAAMGGSLPGATGHMYARYEQGGKVPGDVGFSYPRTGEIPSNGPGAKKTMASAQNGKEMQYYQNGLDFQPKTISKNGSWLSKYDVAQAGAQVEYGTPEYEEAYNKGEVVTDEGGRSPILLDEVVVKGKPLTEFGKTRKEIAEKNKWEDFAQRYLGNFEKNMGQTLENLPESRKQEYEDYLNKLAFDEYIKTNPQGKDEKRGAYIDRMQTENANSSNFERAYEANADYNDATDINKWRKGLIGSGSLVLPKPAMDYMKQKSDYFSKKEKQAMIDNPISTQVGDVMGTLEPLTIPVESMYGNKSFGDIASGQSADIPMSARLLGDPLMLGFEAAPLIGSGFRTAGRLLGTEEGLIGKVSQEININRNLGKIKKEGQLQGLSDYEIAKKQMEQVGITSNQRKAYTPLASEFAEKYIKPRNYTGTTDYSQKSMPTKNKFQEIIENIKKGGYKEAYPERIDAWKLYLGRPQVRKTFNLADTAPALHPSYKPGSLEGMDIYNINSRGVKSRIGYNDTYTPGTSGHLDVLESPMSIDRDPAIMGGYNKILTKEGTQYNDIWDLEPGVNLKTLFPNAISENSKFENIFYKTLPNGVQSPRGFKIPVEKFVGKPFMSHGNLPYTSTEHVNLLKENILSEIERFKPQVNTAFEGPQRMAKMQADLKNLENYPKYKKGGIIKDDRGQWDHPGEITEIGSNDITMEGVPYDVLGISDTGDTKLMKPGKNYKFKGKKVTEYPMAKNGLRQEQKGLQNLDQLTNFTNYNKPTVGGWLNKYN